MQWTLKRQQAMVALENVPGVITIRVLQPRF